jgi:hypothetical protein
MSMIKLFLAGNTSVKGRFFSRLICGINIQENPEIPEVFPEDIAGFPAVDGNPSLTFLTVYRQTIMKTNS